MTMGSSILFSIWIYTVKNKKYSNAEYWGKIPGIFKLFHRYSKMENVQNI